MDVHGLMVRRTLRASIGCAASVVVHASEREDGDAGLQHLPGQGQGHHVCTCPSLSLCRKLDEILWLLPNDLLCEGLENVA
jgi:hypothetical protein